MKNTLILFGCLGLLLGGVSCADIDDDAPSASITRETTTTLDPYTGTSSSQVTTTTTRRDRDD